MLDGRVAFVTGAASGIGKGTALRFAAEGAPVGLADMMDDEGQRVRAEIEHKGGRAIYVDCDVSNPEQVKRAIDRTAEAFGRLDVVFANADINGVWTPIEELKPEEWDKTLDTNLKSTFLTVKYAIPHLRRARGGSIIITSSINGNRKFSNPGATAYSTSKAGQVASMKMAALELSRYEIRVNAVCPGAIHTNIDERTQKRDTEKVEIKVELPEGKPGVNDGRGEPIDVADAVLFLASHMSRHISGVELYVDGGSSLML
jgi:NAD(P)-dependent dehydrogenase (short-subunit alcohol dehydrogenase family)